MPRPDQSSGYARAMYPGTWAATTPDKPALVMAGSGRTLTYAELDDRSLRLARHLRDRGLRTGDVVALLSDNTPEAYEVYWAALRSGLYVTAVNHNLSADEASYIVRDCGAKALVVSAAKADLVRGLDVGVGERLAYGGAVAGTVLGGFDDFGQDTVYLSPAPVYHAAPLRFGGVVHALGGTLVMMERFDAEGALRAIEQHRVTHTQMVPTMFVRLLKLDEQVRASYDVGSLRCVVHAAAPCPVEVKQRMIDWLGPIVQEYYASTEANGATMIDSETWLAHPGSVGTALLGVLHICGEDGAELGPGEVGTVYFERDAVPFAYHNDPEKTAGTQHPAHPTWTTVGDLGYVDEEGFLFLTDRKAFMIISGGVNIYPQEVEDLFSLHPAVADIAVVGVPDEEMGERVVAFVQPSAAAVPGDDLASELKAYARDRIAHYKVPREIVFRDELPRTPTGKMVKGRLREEYAGS